ncbi:MAG: membrane protein insertion efficiency factor YidD [Candidatus Omnitrophota bacterium]|nr:MAG: membrane protein insertion efficiency factor YidD [Candidatus Omnitrophota bacterium]
MNKITLLLIALYQRVSFLFPARCRYIPTCSEYARQAFLQYPFLKAMQLTGLRLLRCNPFAKGVVDPLP